MIEMVTWTDGQAHDHAPRGDLTADSAATLARLLVAAGAPDQAWRTVTRVGTVSLRGASLHRLAALHVAETDSGMGWGFYRPHPRHRVPALLADVLAAAPTRRVQGRASGLAEVGGPSLRRDASAPVGASMA